MDPKTVSENVSLSVCSHLLKYASALVRDSDLGGIMTDNEIEKLAEKCMSALSIDTRTKLYASVFVDELSAITRQSAENAVAEKMKKAFRRG